MSGMGALESTNLCFVGMLVHVINRFLWSSVDKGISIKFQHFSHQWLCGSGDWMTCIVITTLL